MRQALIFLAAAFAAIVLLLNGVIFVVAYKGNQLTDELNKALIGDRAAVEVWTHLVRASRAHRMAAESGDPRFQTSQDQAEERLFAWVTVLREVASLENEQMAAEDVHRAVVEFHADVLSRDPKSALAYLRQLDVIDTAITTYMGAIAANADKMVEETRSWTRWGIALALAAAAVSLLALWVLYRSSWRMIYLPVSRLRSGMDDAVSDPDVRVPEEGPAELVAVAKGINGLLTSVAERRAEQLAFLAAVSHDLRNPITTLKTGAELAARRTTSDVERGRLDALIRQVDRINRLVDDLVEVGRIEVGAFDLELEEVDLREVVRDTFSIFEGSSESHTLHCAVPAEPVVIPHDPARISQVLNNLMSNAIKYAPSGGDVWLRLYVAAGEVVMEVQDHGVGMKKEDLGTIFEPFQRGHASAGAIPGVGLGLSVVRRLVRAHGGTITVESEPGVGSTFRVHLPTHGPEVGDRPVT